MQGTKVAKLLSRTKVTYLKLLQMSLQSLVEHCVNSPSTTATHFPQPHMLEQEEWKKQLHWLASMLQEFIMFNFRWAKFVPDVLFSVRHVCVYTDITEPKLDHGIKLNRDWHICRDLLKDVRKVPCKKRQKVWQLFYLDRIHMEVSIIWFYFPIGVVTFNHEFPLKQLFDNKISQSFNFNVWH